jgi:Fe-S-cluster containining protein
VKSVVKNKWYIGGLHFACQQCGSCCSGPEEGVIWISRPEINMLAEHLGLSASELREKYLRRIGFRFSIKENPCSKDCVFLVTINGSRGCTIYDVRPMQCRNWPFWPGNLNSPDDWNAAAKKCPGIDKGRLYSFDEIQKIKKQKQWWNNTDQKICDEVKKIYDWLDSTIKPLNNKCDACGKCCNFDSFGHKLFITTPELLYFMQNVTSGNVISSEGLKEAEVEKSIKKKVCPYLKDEKCTVRNFRFAGCRIFFCKEDKNLQNKLSEETIEKFKALCDKFNLPYRYVDFASAVNNPELAQLIKL